MLDVALKELAVVCQALAEGRQALLLQKADANSVWEFGNGPTRFWLWPTFGPGLLGISPEVDELKKAAASNRPPDGKVRLTHFVDIVGVYHVHDESAALAIAPLHIWSEEAIRKMFRAPPPGLVVVAARVYSAAAGLELPEKAGSVTYDQWTFLDRPLETLIAEPVLTEDAIRQVQRRLEAVLKPTALA